MNLARIDGTLVASAAHPSLSGCRLVICQPIDGDGRDEGLPVVAIDTHGAGLHERVVLSTDGATTRERVGDPRTPLRNLIIGVVNPLL